MATSNLKFPFKFNNVKSGGRTVFPKMGFGVEPEAGAAVMWYNLRPSGRSYDLTYHAACPVKFGTKWGKNKIAELK